MDIRKMEQKKLYPDHVSINKSHIQSENKSDGNYEPTKIDKKGEKSSMFLLQKDSTGH